MTGAIANAAAGSGLADWQPLRYFNLYRATLAGLLVVLSHSDTAPQSFGGTDPRMFIITAWLYLLFSIASSFTIQRQRPDFDAQAFVQVLVDILAITLLMHASGGISSGFGVLLLVAIAGGSILSVGRTSILFAAIATLAVLGEEIYAWAYGSFHLSTYTQSGMLGAALFATAALIHVLARRIRESEELAERRGVDLASMEQLNEHIIHRLQSGVLALDGERRVRLMNDSARRLLGLDEVPAGRVLWQAVPELSSCVDEWRRGDSLAPLQTRLERDGLEVNVAFTDLGGANDAGTLIFLDDSSAMNQRAQQLKLASLGRLTASIAHEIRNPLGAISHAGQLLAESNGLNKEDERLTRIIIDQSRRMNAIIENVMELSRRREPAQKSFALHTWLEDFVAELASDRGLSGEDIQLEFSPDVSNVCMDDTQLHQVLRNLCENGLRYSRRHPLLTLRAGLQAETERPYLEVLDSGEGIADEVRDHLFEPLVTTEASGTGLGLYIAKELCEVNKANLSHIGKVDELHGFRVTFAHPLRGNSQLHE